MRLRCLPNSKNEVKWTKDGKPIYVDYDHVIFIKDALYIRDPLIHTDNGKYYCNGHLRKTITGILPPITSKPKIKLNETNNRTTDVFDSFLQYQIENPWVTILGVGILALLLIYIFSKFAEIYKEASINYAKYKFVKKGLNLKDKVEEIKAKRIKKKPSKISKESNKFSKLIEDEKWSLIL